MTGGSGAITSVQPELDRVILEPRTGGRWYEVGVDGSECDWGHVVAWEPSTRLVLAWQIGADWKFDPQLVTEVEIRFVDLGDNRTRVDLEHRDLDRFGDSADDMRAGLGSPGGWQDSTHSSLSSEPFVV